MVGAGEIPLSAIGQLLAIGGVSQPLLHAVIAFLDDGNAWAAERLTSEPGWVLDSALREGGVKTFAAYMDSVSPQEISELRLGKVAEAQLVEAEKLHKQVTPYAYGPAARPLRRRGHRSGARRGGPDRVRSRGGRSSWIGLCTGSSRKRRWRGRSKDCGFVPLSSLRRRSAPGRRTLPPIPRRISMGSALFGLRELADQAHGVHLDLGSALLNGLSAVDPLDMNVARFSVYALRGPDYDGSSWTKAGERVHHLAVAGIRLVIDELRADVTRTRKVLAFAGNAALAGLSLNGSLGSSAGTIIAAITVFALAAMAPWALMLVVGADAESAAVGAGLRAAAGHAASDGAARLGRIGGRINSGLRRAGSGGVRSGGSIRPGRSAARRHRPGEL
jgi:hypothetical protein